MNGLEKYLCTKIEQEKSAVVYCVVHGWSIVASFFLPFPSVTRLPCIEYYTSLFQPKPNTLGPGVKFEREINVAEADSGKGKEFELTFT